MTAKVEIASDAAATTWEDITDQMYLEGARFAGTASRGEIDTGSGFNWRDDAGTRVLPWRRRVRVTESAVSPGFILWQGRTVGDEVRRGPVLTGDAKMFDVNLVDVNADFGGMPFAGVQRPAESDVDRIDYLLDTYIGSGQNRPSTVIGDAYFNRSIPYALTAHLYSGVQLIDWFTHMTDTTGRDFFLTKDYDLFHDIPAATSYAATIAITDDSPDYSTSFPPILPEATEDATEMFTRVRGRWKSGTVTVIRSSVETANDQWGTTIVDESVTSAAAMATKANVFLDEFDHSRTSFRCSVQLPADMVDTLSWGMTVSFRSAAVGVLTPTTYRITRLSWGLVGEGLWQADMEINYASKFRRASNPGSPPVVGPVPFVPPPSGGAGVYIQSKTGRADSGVLTVTLDNTPTAGNLLLIWLWARGGSNAMAGISPTGFTTIDGIPTSPFDLWHGYKIAGSSESPAFATTGSYAGGMRMIVAEFAGIEPPSDTDKAVLAAGTYSADHSISPTGSGFVTGIFLAATDILGRETHISSPSTIIEEGAVDAPGNGPYGSAGYHASAPLTAHSGNTAFQDVAYMVSNHPTTFDSEGAGPLPGQPVTEYDTGDGSTTTFATDYPYASGSLRVLVNGVDVTASVTETTPTSGVWDISSAPANGASIVIHYLGAPA